MVKLDVITTRGGDLGETSLGDGSRVRKDTLRVEAYGTVDELNATLGLVRLHADPEGDAMLTRIQQDLFDLGADLCVPGVTADRLRIAPSQCLRLETEIATMTNAMPPLHSFVLPGGTPAAAFTHLARTIARRAERQVVSLAALEPVNPEAVRFLNRLSDHLFVLSRRFNANGAADLLWTPGLNREA